MGGTGADKVNARDGRRDVIDLTGLASEDVVYYAKGIDKLVVSAESARASARASAPRRPPHHNKCWNPIGIASARPRNSAAIG